MIQPLTPLKLHMKPQPETQRPSHSLSLLGTHYTGYLFALCKSPQGRNSLHLHLRSVTLHNDSEYFCIATFKEFTQQVYSLVAVSPLNFRKNSLQ